MRTVVLWCGLGVLAVQLGVAVVVDQFAQGVRDPEYRHFEKLALERCAEAPERPLVLAMGSSRTLMGLDAGTLTRLRSGTDAPLVVNGGFCAAGPMMNKILLSRLLAAGVRPKFIFFEMMPMSLSARDGAAYEERMVFQGRFSLGEALGMWPSTDAKHRLCWHWGRSRLFPCVRHQVELREALGIDLTRAREPKTDAADAYGKDAYGWGAVTKPFTPEEIETETRCALALFDRPMKQPAISKGAERAYREWFALAAAEGIAGAVVFPPDSSRIRGIDPAVAAVHAAAARRIADDFGLPVVDAREWVDDDGFFDGHHMTADGARRYTERFGREALPLVPGIAREPVDAQPVSRARP
jgi:hypothetical protein